MSIKRGDRMFVRLAAIGECNEDGKPVFTCGYKGNAVGQPDRPLGTLAVGFIAQIVEMARYSSITALQDDLRELKTYIDELQGEKA